MSSHNRSTTCIDSVPISPEMAESIAFIGESLAPYFMHDPKRDESDIRPLFEMFARLDATQAAHEWPFVEDNQAFVCIDQMQAGLEGGPTEEALYWEYRRLFVGPQKKAAPPWGSVYLDKDQVMFGSSTMCLHDWMRRNGIGVRRTESDEPEDHIATLLLMMAYLARNKSDVLCEFLQLHLLPWADHFLTGMREASTHPFYRGLAELTRLSLKGIQEVLCITVTYPRFYR